MVLRRCEMRAAVAAAAARLADEERCAALRSRRIARGRSRIAALERVAEFVEWRAAAHQCFLEGGERLADIVEHPLVIRRHQSAERALIVVCVARANQRRDMRRGGAHLARLEERPDALRPETVVRAVPAIAAIERDVQEARRVAFRFREAEGGWASVLEMAERLLAARAEERPRAGELRLIEEP